MNETKTTDVIFYERINLTRNYKILSAIDPYTGKNYDSYDIYKLNLINFKNGIYNIPSKKNESININIAIENGYLNVELVNESMESFSEYITYKNEVFL
jgi:hypothetical protein